MSRNAGISWDFHLIKAFALFDEVLSEDVYKELGITQRQQTYKKSMKLRDAAPEAESRMSDAVDSSNTIIDLSGWRLSLLHFTGSETPPSLTWNISAKSPILFTKELFYNY